MKRLRKIIGVDFDGTLSDTHGIYPDAGAPIQEVIDYILYEQSQGAYLVLITMREGEALDIAVDWCEQQGIVFDAVNDNIPEMKDFFKNNPRKIFCNEYIDNTNLGGIEFILQEIRRKRQETN